MDDHRPAREHEGAEKRLHQLAEALRVPVSSFREPGPPDLTLREMERQIIESFRLLRQTIEEHIPPGVAVLPADGLERGPIVHEAETVCAAIRAFAARSE